LNDSFLTGKAAIITGGGSGIGRAIAQKYLKAGATISLADLYQDRLASFQDDVKKDGVDESRILTLSGDASNYDFAADLIRETKKKFGRIDILVNNAGGSYGVGGVDFVKMEEKAWDITINGNLYSMLNCVKHALPVMIEQRSGRIINLGSTTGMGDSVDGGDGLSVYAACKAGVIAFTKAVAREVGRYGINVNAISPGIVRTRVFERLSREYIDGLVSKTPLGRIAEPEDIANIALFLASDEASFLTGQNICPSGGLVMH
jgi:3-oxoacyl-[acyl-carrier protein] reductase